MSILHGVRSFIQTKGGITAELLESKDWAVYSGLPLEMIACRKGRNLFPYLKFRLTGLDPSQMYYIFLEFRRHGDKRFSYDPSQQSWSIAEEEESLPETKCVYESDISPKMGRALERMEISFRHVKLVNTKQDKPEISEQQRKMSDPKIFVHTKCFYQPYLLVQTANKNGGISEGSIVWDFHFPITQFVTVTAYRNNRITELKIEHNPKARAFKIKKARKSGRSLMEDEENGSAEAAPAVKYGRYEDGLNTIPQLNAAPAPEYMYSPQNAMYGYPPHYGYHQAAAAPMEQQQQQQQQQQQMQDVNNQNSYFNPLHYNNSADSNNLLPVATQQLHHPSYAAVDMQNYASAMPTATNGGGDVSGPYYVEAPQQQQQEYATGVATGNQQQFPVQTSSPAADIIQLNNVYNAAAAECYPGQSNTVGHQFAQLETIPTTMAAETGVPALPIWEHHQQQQHYQQQQHVEHAQQQQHQQHQQQQFYGGYDTTAPPNGAMNNIEGQV